MDKRKNGWIVGAGKHNKDLYEKNLTNYYLNPQYCNFCNKQLEYAPKFIREERKFCSKTCSAKYHNKLRLETSFYQKGLTKKSQCVICKKELYISKNASSRSCKCSSCRNTLKIRKPKKEIICSICQTSFISNHRKTCSVNCAKIAKLKGARNGGKKSAQSQSITRRSKNEIYFAELCGKHFENVAVNKAIFNGWDADIILMNQKIAILWNGVWHYKKITQKHSVKQVQNRDKIKIKEIIKYKFEPYIIKDMGKANKNFVEKEFNKFCVYIKGSGGGN